MIFCGLDLGFYQTKITSGDKNVKIESIVGYDSDSMVSWGYDSSKYSFVEPQACCGATAIKYASHIIRYKDDRWLNSKEIKILSQMALSEISDGNDIVSAITAIPIRLFKAQRGVLTRNISGTSTFQREGRNRQNLVVNLHEIPQGFGVLCDEVLNDNGYITSDNAVSRVGVIDIGGRNTNIYLADEMRDVKHSSDSINTGCWNVIEQLRDSIAIKFNRPSISDHAIEQAWRNRVLLHDGVDVDISPLCEQAERNVLSVITSAIERLWEDLNSINLIVIAGGGSVFFGDTLLAKYQQAKIVDEPIFANSRGAYKYARLINRIGGK